MNAPVVLAALDVATITCALLLAARVLAAAPGARSAQLIALIAFATACGVLLGRQDYGYWIAPAFRVDLGGFASALNLARNLTPGLFMLLCFSLFTDRPRFPRWLLALFAVQLLLEEPGRALILPTWRYARLVGQVAPTLLQTLFAGFALYWTVADWRIDLIEQRRRTRLLILAVSALLTLVSGVLTRVVIEPDSAANYAAHVALTVADLAIIIFILFQLTEVDVGRNLGFEPARAALRPVADLDTGAPLTRLTALLEVEKVWQEERLSLKGLAAQAGLPEYRLRRLIHEHLGYRNFNALLHEHRVREACRQLGDPGLRGTPILTIALSVGYGSVNTFNRGFREILGLTPSAWRAAALDRDAASHAE